MPKKSNKMTFREHTMIMRGRKVIRNSTKSIIRMVETDENVMRSLLGTIKLSNMIPVPSNDAGDISQGNSHFPNEHIHAFSHQINLMFGKIQ